MKITYFISLEKRAQQIISVRLVIEEITDPQVQITLPNWTPGSYKIRDYSGKIRTISFRTSTGAILKAAKLDKSSWKVARDETGTVEVIYEIYASELTPRASHADATHALLNPSGLLFYVEGYKEQTSEIELSIPDGWRITTGLEKIDGNRFRATNYDILADTPFEIGTQQVFTFRVDGREHEISIYGNPQMDLGTFVADVEKIANAASSMMKGIPCKRYCFIFDFSDTRGGGLEHLNSTVIIMDRLMPLSQKSYRAMLSTVAHEYFHMWNVKRIRPVELGPFNYKVENYTNMLWFAEGITDYYANKLLLRAGIVDRSGFFEYMARHINTYFDRPGRKRQSLYESSFDSWIKQYQPTADTLNSSVSYYLGGMMLGFALDLKIVTTTLGQKSLDDLIRLLFEKYRKDGKGYTEKDLLGGLKEITGQDLTAFIDSYVKGTEEIPFESLMVGAGLELTVKQLEEGWSGIILKREGATTKVVSVVEGSSAWDADLIAEDEILAVNGIRISEKMISSEDRWFEGKLDRFARLFPQSASITFFRRSELMTTTYVPKNFGRDVSIKESKDQEAQVRKMLEKLLAG